MEDLVNQRKSFVLFLVKQTQNFAWVYILMLIIVTCLLMEEKSLSLKLTIENANFPTQFCLGSIYNGFNFIESREVCLNGNVYHFSVDYNFIDRSDILNIQNHLMTKNDIK